MKMLSQRWSKNIALSLLALACLTNASSAGPVEDAQARAMADVSGNQVLGLYGSQEGSNTNISIPMTNTGTQLRSVDGNTSFSANLTSPSSAAFLHVMIQPSGTGDLQQVMISQDLDMDGNMDYTYTVPRPVSGLCANGYYSCSPGSWTGCSTYRWVSDASGRVSDTSTSVVDLGGCYCINSSCGSQLPWNNTDIILKDIGGGIVAAVQSANIGFTVTNVSLGTVTIDYYGRMTGNAATQNAAQTQTLPSPITSQNYYLNVGNMSNDLTNITIAQSSDPTSLYYMMMNSPAVTQSSANTQSCSVTRVGSIATDNRTFSNSGVQYEGGTVCADHFFYMQIWRVSDTDYRIQMVGTGPGGLPDIDHGCGMGSRDANGWYTLGTISLPPNGGNTALGQILAATFSVNNMNSPRCDYAGAGYMNSLISGFNSPVQVNITCSASGTVRPYFDWNYYFQQMVDTYSETINDTCSALASNPDCRIMEETVGGVKTVQNFNSTGLSPLPSCIDFAGGVNTMNVCRPWWSQTRTYMCTTSNPWNFSDLRTRYGSVVGTTALSGDTVGYTDLSRDSSGNWVTNTGSGALPVVTSSSSCELSCRTRAPHEDNEITTSGVASSLRANATGATDYLYKVCVNGQCPLTEPGETIVDNCQCLSGFNEAAVAIQALRMAGKDTICTTYQSKPIH